MNDDPAARSGDLAAERVARERFEALYQVNCAPLAAYALRRAASPDDASDLVADAFMVAWRRLEEVPEGREATMWLFGVARRLLANQRRGERRRRRLFQRLSLERSAMPAGIPELAGELDAVRAALQRLPARQRDLLGLVAWEGLNATELATVLDCSPNAAKIRLHRARRRLIAELRAVPKPEDSREQQQTQIAPAAPTPGETR